MKSKESKSNLTDCEWDESKTQIQQINIRKSQRQVTEKEQHTRGNCNDNSHE